MSKKDCSVFIPSWSLSLQLEDKDKARPSVPKTIAVVRLRDKILLVDAERSRPWLSFDGLDGDDLAFLGDLATVTFDQRGQLILLFERGGLLLDLAEDLILLAKGNGDILLSRHGIAAGQLDDFHPVFSGSGLGEERHARFLLMRGRMLITTRGIVEFSLSHAKGFQVTHKIEGSPLWQEAALATTSAGADEVTIISRERDGIYTSYRLGAQGRLIEPREYRLPSPAPNTVRWVGAKPYAKIADGTWILAGLDATSTPTKIPATWDGARIASGGSDFLVSRASSAATSSDCEWVHWQPDPTRVGDFREANFFRAPCDQTVVFGRVNRQGTLGAVTWTRSGQASIHLWWSPPSP